MARIFFHQEMDARRVGLVHLKWHRHFFLLVVDVFLIYLVSVVREAIGVLCPCLNRNAHHKTP